MNICDIGKGRAANNFGDIVALDLRGRTRESTAYFRASRRTFGHYVSPVSRQRASVGSRFRELYWDWESATQYDSSVHKMAVHPAYLQIIGLGAPAIPFILAELRRQPAHLFIALHAITGENPVTEEHEGDIEAMTADWLAWGRSEGHIE